MENEIKSIKKWLGYGSINIFGLPFAGKDTQGEKLAVLLEGVLISGGDVLRQAKTNIEVQKSMASGSIIPTELFKQVMLPYFSENKFQDKPLILSEVGRLKGEPEMILPLISESGHALKAVVLLEMPDEEVWKRFEASLQSGDRSDRADDNKEVIQTRINQYREMVSPVLEFYRRKNLLLTVNGSNAREKVTEDIIMALARFSAAD